MIMGRWRVDDETPCVLCSRMTMAQRKPATGPRTGAYQGNQKEAGRDATNENTPARVYSPRLTLSRPLRRSRRVRDVSLRGGAGPSDGRTPFRNASMSCSSSTPS